jgi:hypothetical protein
MVRAEQVLTIPKPHRGDIGLGLLAVILRQAGGFPEGLGTGVNSHRGWLAA